MCFNFVLRESVRLLKQVDPYGLPRVLHITYESNPFSLNPDQIDLLNKSRFVLAVSLGQLSTPLSIDLWLLASCFSVRKQHTDAGFAFLPK